ncbi:hypothetical protein AAFC00_000327 [Neodothiora populina]|uniref:Beta-hexosaminidase n=1 Tax=Neodothiora populina TaxID=2781224 RepID=A0ABR3PCJ1_9PEZI
MFRGLKHIAIFVSGAAALWPIPSTYSNGSKVLWIDNDVQISYNGVVQLTGYDTQGLNLSSSSATIIKTAIETTTKTLFDEQFVPWMFHPRFSDYEPSSGNASKTIIKSIALRQNGSDPVNVFKPLDGSVDESYTLSVSDNGTVVIAGSSSLGLAHGLKTFTQLFYKHSDGSIYTPLAPVEVRDAPKFAHRGLNMDVARSWYEPEDIKKMIDALSYNKFNRLHIHITDSQSWPLEIPALPGLAEKGAFGKGKTYSPSTLASIQAYGSARGVETVLEIDAPGHTASIAYSYPELISAFNILPDWSTYAAEPPTGTLKLNSSAVGSFVDTLFEDLLPRISPYSAYFHTGGDEVNANAYNLDDTVGTNDTAVLQPLIQAYVDRAHKHVRAAGLTPIVWEEMLLIWNLTLGSDVIVQTWQSDEAVTQTVSQGHKALAGNYNYWYLDCGKGQWLDFSPGTSSESYYPYADYCAPVHNWRVMYAYDPLEGVPANLTHLVLGGETHIWSEQTDPANIDRMVWPRACAAGEVLWSGAKDASGQNRSQVTASPRLADMRERLVKKGIMAEPVHMVFCTMNGTQCAL